VVSSSVCAGNIRSSNQLGLARRTNQHVLLLYLNIAPCRFGSTWGVHYFKFSQERTAVAQGEFIELVLDSFKAVVKDMWCYIGIRQDAHAESFVSPSQADSKSVFSLPKPKMIPHAS
jgi:hypothetical protein